MNATPHPEPETIATLHAQDALYFRDILVELIDLGARLTRRLVGQAEAGPDAPTPSAEAIPDPAPDPTIAYARITRSIRRSILLCQKLTALQQARDAEDATANRVAMRKAVIRNVEDAIHKEARAAEAGDLHAELHERLEGPEFDDGLDRPLRDIVNEIRADLGIHGADSLYQFKRRTPEDIAILHQRAAAPCRPNTGPYNLPLPPPGWTGRNRPAPHPAPDPNLRE